MKTLTNDPIQLIASLLDPFSYLEFRAICKQTASALPYVRPDPNIFAIIYSRIEARAAERKGYIPKQSRSHKMLRTLIEKISRGTADQQIIAHYFGQMGTNHIRLFFDYLGRYYPQDFSRAFIAYAAIDYGICRGHKIIEIACDNIRNSGGVYNYQLFDDYMILSGRAGWVIEIAILMLPDSVNFGPRDKLIRLDDVDSSAKYYLEHRRGADIEPLRPLLGDYWSRFVYVIQLHEAVRNSQPIPTGTDIVDIIKLNVLAEPTFTLEYCVANESRISWDSSEFRVDHVDLMLFMSGKIMDARVNGYIRRKCSPAETNLMPYHHIGSAFADIEFRGPPPECEKGYYHVLRAKRRQIDAGELSQSQMRFMRPRKFGTSEMQIIRGRPVERNNLTRDLRVMDIYGFCSGKYTYEEIDIECVRIQQELFPDKAPKKMYSYGGVTETEWVCPEIATLLLAKLCPRVLPEFAAWMAT